LVNLFEQKYIFLFYFYLDDISSANKKKIVRIFTDLMIYTDPYRHNHDTDKFHARKRLNWSGLYFVSLFTGSWEKFVCNYGQLFNT